MMRNRIWYHSSNIKFKSLYTSACSKRADCLGRVYSFILAITTSGSVAAWTIWNQYSNTWAFIIAIAQILQIAKPYIRTIGDDKALMEMSFEYENLYLQYEKLWITVEKNNIDEQIAEERFYELRQKEIDIGKTHKSTYCPNFKGIMKKADQETDSFMILNFEKS